MLYRHVDQNIALEEEYPRVAGSAAVTNLLYLHLWLDVIRKSPKGPGSVIEARGFDLHLAAVAVIRCGFQISETIFFQDGRVGCIGCGRVLGGLHTLGIDAPPTKGLRQRASGSIGLGRCNRRQSKDN